MSDERPPEPRFEPERIAGRLQGTPLGDRLDSREKRRSALNDMLAGHPDPMWREIGRQLQSGEMKPSDMITTPAYRQHLFDGLEAAKARIADLPEAIERGADDPDGFRARVEAEEAAAAEAAARAAVPEPEPVREELRTCPSCGRKITGDECPHCDTGEQDATEAPQASGVRTCPRCGRKITGDECPHCF